MGWFFSQKTLFNYWCLVNRVPTSFPGPRAWRIPVYHSKLSAPSFLSVQLYSFPARSMHMEVSTRKILGSPCLLRRCKFNHELSTGAWRVTYLKWLVSGNDVIFIVLARNNSNFKLLSREPQTHFTLRPNQLVFLFYCKILGFQGLSEWGQSTKPFTSCGNFSLRFYGSNFPPKHIVVGERANNSISHPRARMTATPADCARATKKDVAALAATGSQFPYGKLMACGSIVGSTSRRTSVAKKDRLSAA